MTHCSFFTVLCFFACCAFMHLRATSCYFVMHIKMRGYREGMPLCRVFCVQLNALYIRRAPVLYFLVYLSPPLFLYIWSVHSTSVAVTIKGCLDDRVTEIIAFPEMCCLLLAQATDTENIRILRVNNESGWTHLIFIWTGGLCWY